MKRIAAITGMEAEARLARDAGLVAMASGGVAAQTLAFAEAAIKDGAAALVSFGIAGALAPHLASGTLLLPRAVIAEDGTQYAVDEAWRAQVEAASRAAALPLETGDIFGAEAAIAAAEQKAALHRKTGAVAVDLESHLVARVAAKTGTPFLVLRAIADPATRTLPPAALDGLGADGKPALGRVLLSVARSPLQIAALIRLAGDTRRALSALGSALKTRPFDAADEGRVR